MMAVAAEREEAQKQPGNASGNASPRADATVNIKDVFAKQMAQRVQEEIDEYNADDSDSSGDGSGDECECEECQAH